MDDEKKALPEAGLDLCTQNMEKECSAGNHERIFLLLTLGFCILAVDCFLFSQPGIGITGCVGAWYALTVAYLGRNCLRRGECRFLLGVNLFLAATFAVTSNPLFQLWNLGALVILLPIHAVALSGTARRSWWEPGMLGERLGLTLRGVFGHLEVIGFAVTGQKQSRRRIWACMLGLFAAALLMLVLVPVLASADALFASFTDSIRAFFRMHLVEGLARVLIGLGVTPFLFGFLWSLRRPAQQNETPVRAHKTAEPMAFLILLAALDVLYLLFLAIQVAGLAGGAAYLAQKGISYAEWARSGFFQMVGVTDANLTILLTAVHWVRREGRPFRVLQVLAVALITESFVLLVSAAWRMSLYVGAYGLSFKRVMTYWGMTMMVIFLAAAMAAVLRESFCFCRVAFAAALIGWIVINCVPIDGIVAADGVNRYLAGENSVDLWYLTYGLSYDSLNQLERLSGTDAEKRFYEVHGSRLQEELALRRREAHLECEKWESWTLSACLAARGKP